MKIVPIFFLFLFIFPSSIFKKCLADDTSSPPKLPAAALAHIHHHHHHHHHHKDDADSPSFDNDGDYDGDDDGDDGGDDGDDNLERCLDSFSTIDKCIEEAIVSLFRLRFYVGPACCKAFTTIDKDCSPKYEDRKRKHHFIKAKMRDSCHRRHHGRPSP